MNILYTKCGGEIYSLDASKDERYVNILLRTDIRLVLVKYPRGYIRLF